MTTTEITAGPNPGEPHRPTRRPVAVRAERQVVTGLAVLAAVLAVPTRAHPSGLGITDALLRAAFGAGVVWFAGAARRWTWFVLAGAAGVLGGGLLSPVLAALALFLSYGAAFAPRRARIVGGLVALISSQILLRLPDRLPPVLTGLAVLAAVTPCLWSGIKLHSHRARRRMRIVAEVVGVLAALVTLAFGVALVEARTSVDQSVAEAQKGLEQARLGNQGEAIRHFESADVLIRKSQRALDAWWAQPARAVPLVGIQAKSLTRAVDGIRLLVRQSVVTARSADYGRLRASNGQIDLDLLRSFQAPVEDLIARLVQTRRDLDGSLAPWLLPPLRSQIEGFDRQVVSSTGEARSALEVLQVAPRLLGADGPRRYALLFSTPSESRELGGYAGNVGELTAVNGKLTLDRTVRSSELAPATEGELAERQLPNDDQLPTRYRYYRPARDPGNVTGTEDFPTVARTFDELYPETGGPSVDGVIYIDPYALAGLLRLTGPVAVEGLNQPLTADNAASFLLKGQYAIFSSLANRVDYLDNASRATFEQLTNRRLPPPKEIADVLLPLVDQRRLLAYSFHPEDQELLDRIGLDGPVPRSSGDYLSMTTANANPNKIDAYLERSIAYDARYDPTTGAVTSTATVTLHNSSPSTGLPDYTISNEAGLPFGTNHTFFSLYSSLELESAERDGQPVATEPQIEYGRNRYGLFVDVPPGGTTTLTFRLRGGVRPSTTYHLTFLDQPAVNADQLAVTLEPGGGSSTTLPRVSGPAGMVRRSSTGSRAEVRAAVAGGVISVRVPLRTDHAGG